MQIVRGLHGTSLRIININDDMFLSGFFFVEPQKVIKLDTLFNFEVSRLILRKNKEKKLCKYLEL